jgi:hypothetical protein
MRTLLAVLCLAVLTAGPRAYAKISVVTLEELIQSSDQVVLANIARVEESHVGSRTVLSVEARVIKTLKGKQLDHVRFLAYPSGPETMDSTDDAVVGEKVLLFLYEGSDGVYGIKQAGRGRMPISTRDGKVTAEIYANDIVLPAGAPVLPGSRPEYGFIVSVPLFYLEQQIDRVRKGAI